MPIEFLLYNAGGAQMPVYFKGRSSKDIHKEEKHR